MAKSKKEIKKLKIADTKSNKEKLIIKDDAEQIAEIEISTLMPELEELVKKNPNRLIGCGG